MRWSRHPRLAGDRPESIALFTYLLDADRELAEEFDVRARVAARQLATARVLQVGVGACDLAPWFRSTADGSGLLILDGILAFETRVGGRTVGRAGRPRGSAAAARAGVGSTCSCEPAAGVRCARPGSRCSTATSPTASGRSPR